MASINLPVEGDDEDVWGAKLNTAITAVNAELTTTTATANGLSSAVSSATSAAAAASTAAADALARGVPTGGAAGTGLVKNSSTNGDTSWVPVVKTVNGVAPDGAGNVAVSGTGTWAPVNHTHTPSQVGLSLVQNIAPADMPVSQQVASELAGKASTTHTHAVTDVTGLSSALSSRVQVVAVTTGSEARPAGSSVVFWFGGSTQPAQMATGDYWFSEEA